MGQSQPTLLHFRERISHTLPHRGKGSVTHCSNNNGGSVTLYHKGTAKVMGQSHFTVPKVKHQSYFALADVKDQLHIALAMIKDQSHFNHILYQSTKYMQPDSSAQFSQKYSLAQSNNQASQQANDYQARGAIFFFTGIHQWNALPAHIKSLQNYVQFKKAVKSHFLSGTAF